MDTDNTGTDTRLDEWECHMAIAALRQYLRYELMPLRTDTKTERKRRLFFRAKAKTASAKIRRMRDGQGQ